MSILKFTPKITEQTTVSEIEKLQQRYDVDGKRFYLVTRHTDEYQQNTFNIPESSLFHA
jgi:cyclopropane fatty-acyl-phospholipid synthase-like methyltransferase